MLKAHSMKTVKFGSLTSKGKKGPISIKLMATDRFLCENQFYMNNKIVLYE